VNKALTLIGAILIVVGVIGSFYLIQFMVAVIVGIVVFIVGITLERGKSAGGGDEERNFEFCPNCGSSIKKGSKYCGYCRKKL
jgi:hypothetical protein